MISDNYKVLDEIKGQEIIAAEINDNHLYLTLIDDKENKTKISIYDDAQYCCESRYMCTDDDIQTLIGSKLASIEAKHGPTEGIQDDTDYGDIIETCFIEISTDKGFITLANHNAHNGYYSGFDLIINKDN